MYEETSGKFDFVHCSDLKRSIDTSFYALGFPSDEDFIRRSHLLREMNFGEQEGLHFDNLPDSEKLKFSQPDFRATGGESWQDVRERAQTYFKTF